MLIYMSYIMSVMFIYQMNYIDLICNISYLHIHELGMIFLMCICAKSLRNQSFYINICHLEKMLVHEVQNACVMFDVSYELLTSYINVWYALYVKVMHKLCVYATQKWYDGTLTSLSMRTMDCVNPMYEASYIRVCSVLHTRNTEFHQYANGMFAMKVLKYSHYNFENIMLNECKFIYNDFPNCKMYAVALMTGKRKFSEANANNKYFQFVVDSGCSSHMTNVDIKYMHHVEPMHTLIGTAGDHSLRSTHKGCLGILKHVLHVPSSKFSLLSVSNVCDDDLTVVFTRNKVCFYNSNEISGYLQQMSILHEGYREGNLYVLDISNQSVSKSTSNSVSNSVSLVANATTENRYTMWHNRLNHINQDALRRLRDTGMYQDMTWSDDEYIAHRSKICHGCATGKLTVSPTRKVSGELIDAHHPSNRPGGLILIDLFFSNITSYNSNELGLVIVDAHSKCTWATFGRSKEEAPQMFLQWLELMKQMKFQVSSICKLRSDNGGEFISSGFMDMLSENGIMPERAPPYAHVNRAERAIRHLKETARSYINTNYTNLSRLAAWKTKGRTANPFIFWNEAVRHASHVFNVLPEKKLISKCISRYERFFGRKPDMSRLRTFGCTGYVHVSRDIRKSFDNTSVMGVYLGFNPLSPQTWRMMNISTGSIVESRTVIFNENVDEQNIPMYIRGGGNSQDMSPDEYWQDSADTDDPELSTPSQWDTVDAIEQSYVTTINDRESNDIDYVNFKLGYEADMRIPNTVREAKESPEWSAAYDREIKSFVDNDILEFVPRKADMKVLSWRWIFKVKENMVTGDLTYKARGTLRGDHQVEGVDYNETFAPVARLKSLRLLLSIVCEQDLECDNMDVDTAFLYGEKQADEPDVYVSIPHGFPIPSHIQKSGVPHVGKLRRHVYGLKQAPRTWFRTLSEYMVVIGFVPCVHDPCLFVRRSNDRVCYIFVYVDDLVIAANTVDEMNVIKAELRNKWSMKDLGPLESILGIRVIRNRQNRTLTMSQEKYVDNLLIKFKLSDVKSVKTPLDPGCSLSKDMSPVTEEQKTLALKQPYRQVVGSLMYLMVCTRPDIAFAICQLSRYSSNHGSGHWSALMHVMRYVKGTKDLGITFRGNCGLYPCLFSDASYASDKDSRRSVSGYISYVGGGPVSWKSKLQSTTALSTCESEYIALCAAAQESVHLRWLFNELVPGVKESAEAAPIVVYEDNKATIDISKNPCLHEKQKHVDVKYHFVRECVLERRIQVQYLRTDKMLADVLTKAVQVNTWMKLISKLMGPTNISEHVTEK
jgi:hypothetical protein